MVMPSLIGGYGFLNLEYKKVNPSAPKNSKAFSSSRDCVSQNDDYLGAYLAGIIEGDGSIIVPDPLIKKRYALVRICFNIKDIPLAEHLMLRLGYGKIVYPNKGNYVL